MGIVRAAIAFKTTGPSPKAGHRISELVAIGAGGDRLHLVFGEDGGRTFAAMLPRLEEFIGESEVVVHNAGHWRKFLRPELRGLRKPRGWSLLGRLVDVSAWAHQRFPRQRRDLAAISRRAGIEVPAGIGGIELEAELLRRISDVMTRPVGAEQSATAAVDVLPEATAAVSVRQGWTERVGNFWRGLTGRA